MTFKTVQRAWTNAPVLDNGRVAFAAYDTADTGFAGKPGIYTNIGGPLNVLADTNTPAPDGTGNFNDFSNPTPASKNLVFAGFST